MTKASREIPTYAFQESAPAVPSGGHHRRHRRGGNSSRWGKHSNSSAAAAAATSAPSTGSDTVTAGPVDSVGRNGKAGASISVNSGNGAQHQLGQHAGGGEGGGGAHGDNNDGTGSLTYSASSSVNSGSSATGESTDSSFADIMKVLDLDNSTELAALMVKEGATVPEAQQQALILQQVAHAQQQQQLKQTPGREGTHRSTSSTQGEGNKSPGGSVTDSLMYSTDGDSIGPQPQTVSGQPSDSCGPDGGGGVDAQDGGIVFAPAMPADRRRRNLSKSRTPRARGGGGRRHSMDDEDFRSSPISDKRQVSSSPRAGAGTLPSLSPRPMVRSSSDAERSSCSSGGSTPTSPPPRSTPSKKRLPPPTRTNGEVWYSQWWMCGFTDALKFDPKS